MPSSVFSNCLFKETLEDCQKLCNFLHQNPFVFGKSTAPFSEENWLPDCYVLACFTQCLLKKAAARLFNFLRNLLHQNSLNCQIGLHILCNDGILGRLHFSSKNGSIVRNVWLRPAAPFGNCQRANRTF